MKPAEFEELTPAEWEAIREGDKIRETRLDLRTALVCMVVANSLRDPKTRTYTIEDFMPGEQHEQTPEDQLKMIEALTVQLGGKDERPKEAGR